MSDPMPDPTGELRGLSSDQVAERRAQRGFNELPTAGKSGLLSDIFALLREPMSLLLLVCGGIYAAVGDRQEAAMLLGFVIFIMALTLFQERKTGRALAALRDLASPRALVIRDGRRLRIAGRELVEDDLIVFGEGDRVPADAVVVQASHVVVDESLVSGESVPVRKSAWDGVLPFARPGGEDLPFVYAGTLVTGGAGIARVRATGPRTEIGRIGAALLEQEKPQETALQAEARRLVVKLAWVGGGLSLIAALGYAIAKHDPLGGLLAGLTLGMAILPNEFPVVVTMFLALGAWRLGKREVLARRIPAVESLGAITVWRSRPALLDAKPSAAGNIFAGRVRTASEGQGSPWRQLRIRDQRQQCTAQLGERGDHEERDATQCQALPALRILEGATPETHGLPGGERRR
jgi:Ca2+-transporting ATPase